MGLRLDEFVNALHANILSLLIIGQPVSLKGCAAENLNSQLNP